MSEAFRLHTGQIEATPIDSRTPLKNVSPEYALGTMMVQYVQELDGGWRSQAACNNEDVDPELFFPGLGDNSVNAEKAISVCERCPVRRECLDYALTNNEDIGIWGGKTEAERKKLKRSAKHRR